MSVVTQFPPATSAEAIRWFSHKLHLETDCADVHSAQRAGEVDFVLLHVVGSEEAFARRHLPGAQHLPHSQITAERMAAWPAETLFCGLLRRAALQRCRRCRAKAGRTGAAGENDARRDHRLGR